MQFQACAYCDHPNPVGTNYCNECGAALHLKPCRVCGAVAVAKAIQCPACKTDFPLRPLINVDIPWAVSNASQPPEPAVSALPLPRIAQPEGVSEAEDSEASTRAFAATQRLIEKASTRPMLHETASELVMPASARRPGPRDGSDDMQERKPADLPMRNSLVVNIAPSRSAAGDGPEPDLPRRRSLGPAIFVTFLGLMAAVALVYLIQYAELDSPSNPREIASPHKLLRPAAPQSVVDAAADPATPSVVPALPDAPIVPAGASAVTRVESDAAAATDPVPAAPVPTPAAPVPIPASRTTASGTMPPAMFPDIPSAATSPATEADDCRPELRALNLCGKVHAQ